MSKNLKIIEKEENKEIGFNYDLVDAETGNFMKEATANIFLLKEKTQKSLGEQFSIVQKKLAGNNQYDGLFGKWYISLGFKKDFVYACINYYELLIENAENQKIQTLSFSKVCEVAKLKDDESKQKEVIEKAPLQKMNVKQVGTLIKEVKAGKEVTEELIDEICAETNTNLAKFVKATTSLISDLENQGQDISKENIDKVLKLISEVQDLCSVENKTLETEEAN